MNQEFRELVLRSFESMLLIRRVEERIIEEYRVQNEAFAAKLPVRNAIRCPTHLSIGQEAAAVGVCGELERTDVVLSTHRCHSHYLAKGGSVKAMMAELFGKVTGCARGKGGSMHLVDADVGMLGASAIVGGSLPLAVGAALSFSLRRQPHVAVAFFGDGAVEQGVFHECMNVASLRRLPVVLVCENNFFATLSHVESRQPTSIAERASVYGMTGVRVQGDDVLSVRGAAVEAIKKAREGGGPTLLEVAAYRWMAHVGTETDTGKMRRTKEALEDWQGRCPIERARRVAIEAGVEASALRAIEERVEGLIDEAVAFARESPEPEVREILEHVGAGVQS